MPKRLRNPIAELIAQVEAETDEKGLISADVLRRIPVTRPRKSSETDSRPESYVICSALDATDDEFMDWYLRMILKGDGDDDELLGAVRRVRLRLLLIAALEYVHSMRMTHWREPRLQALGRVA